jgi:hypothetical protein
MSVQHSPTKRDRDPLPEKMSNRARLELVRHQRNSAQKGTYLLIELGDRMLGTVLERGHGAGGASCMYGGVWELQ